jgi:hypothetical protein
MKGAIQQFMGSSINNEEQDKLDKAAQDKERNRRLRVRGKANRGNPQIEVINLLRNFKGNGKNMLVSQIM